MALRDRKLSWAFEKRAPGDSKPIDSAGDHISFTALLDVMLNAYSRKFHKTSANCNSSPPTNQGQCLVQDQNIKSPDGS